MIKTVLVVCIGNICRSPMAQGLLRQALPDAEVVSAGLGALSGHAADPQAVDLMSRQGVDISGHRAQQLNHVLIRRADLILVMDGAQRQEIQRLHPATTGRVFRLGELEQLDVPDPYRQPRAAFESALQLIQRGVESWVPRIRALG
ncbi:low molecular weight protein-tyrosine-phosphatase [Cupriavidus taiwanensis]|uniref:protein-tyrosine-phosphatase n=1 Tax=Cupriavidus taiwanensis TaxID=164546 RepID=A0A375GW29_9BURK|nr:low molecular weight protein-tyrosine-phosphatase [Cupriavidus taiwanensis]SOY42665.1 low molecular weight protein-tyrosine-phosphatase (EPS I polysaccharide export protein) [Cupriavidus taiwanensis]SOY44796.1 low molecular weight protein-tyrosine-phosphatase (EPS I polysaccharide export protein) [Cupriavidus taiwanensis]SOY80674.1 low molecular weight protein-tyrosine-phosphatase (EPS I polysaccharide export protein) [Cupriavidus taiwanensis]SOZ21577.1 low molecular weight protein-tyrosine-